MGGWGNRPDRVSFPDPTELDSGRPGEAGVGCSFRRLFHVAVGKTRKARQRAPLQVLPGTPAPRACQGDQKKSSGRSSDGDTLGTSRRRKEVTAETADEKVIFRGL